MAYMFEPAWPFCDLAGDSLWSWEGANAVLIPYSYSMLQGLQVQSGQLRSSNLIPVLSGVDSVTVCLLFTLFNKISGSREAQSNKALRGAPLRFSRAGTRLEAHYEL